MASQVRPRELIRYRKPVPDEAYLRWIRKQPCLTCGTTYEVEAAHTRVPGQGGQGTKTESASCIPLCPPCHEQGRREHAYHNYGNEAKWAKHHRLDLPAIKADLRRRYVGGDE